MSYINYLNDFWIKRSITPLTSTEADLYICLLDQSNVRSWENPFECRNDAICAKTTMSEKTLIDVRKRLEQKGFISVKAGERKKKSPIYTLLYLPIVSKNVSCKVSNSVGKNVGKNVSCDVSIYKSKSKSNKNNKKDTLNYPFSSTDFFEKWNLLLATPKWKKKLPETLQLALNKIKDFEEAFVLELLDQAIIGNWQGLVFPQTKANYEDWLKRKSKKPNIANHNNGKKYEKF